MAKIKTTLTADDCARYGAVLYPTNRVKYSFRDVPKLISLITVMNKDEDGEPTSNVDYAFNSFGDVAPLDAVRKYQTRILWEDGCLVTDTEAITEQELRQAERRIQETLRWI